MNARIAIFITLILLWGGIIVNATDRCQELEPKVRMLINELAIPVAEPSPEEYVVGKQARILQKLEDLGVDAVPSIIKHMWAEGFPIDNNSRSEGAPVNDAWEHEAAHKPDPQTCSPVDHALIVPVTVRERPNAIAQLEHSPVLALDDRSAATMIGAQESSVSTSVSAQKLVAWAITRLEEQKRRQLETHTGSWSLADQARLDKLKSLSQSSELRMLKPFLARAIAKNEATGGFSASLCGDVLWISHLSLGHSTPLSIRLPVVVFLNRMPANVYLSWGMAR